MEWTKKEREKGREEEINRLMDNNEKQNGMKNFYYNGNTVITMLTSFDLFLYKKSKFMRYIVIYLLKLIKNTISSEQCSSIFGCSNETDDKKK